MTVARKAAGITQRQGEFLAFIRAYTQKRGISPSFDDMATHFGISSPSVNGMIKILEKKGLISRVPGAARTLRVEVGPESLPTGDFAAPSRRPSSGPAQFQLTAAVSSATAVLDVVMPRLLERSLTDDAILQAISEVVDRVRLALEATGVPPSEALASARLVGAAGSRWRPGGRGVSLRKRTWQKRR